MKFTMRVALLPWTGSGDIGRGDCAETSPKEFEGEQEGTGQGFGLISALGHLALHYVLTCCVCNTKLMPNKKALPLLQ